MEGRTKQFRGSSSRKAQTKGKTGHTFNEKAVQIPAQNASKKYVEPEPPKPSPELTHRYRMFTNRRSGRFEQTQFEAEPKSLSKKGRKLVFRSTSRTFIPDEILNQTSKKRPKVGSEDDRHDESFSDGEKASNSLLQTRPLHPKHLTDQADLIPSSSSSPHGTDTKQPSTSSAIGKRQSVQTHKSGNKRARMATSPKHAQEAEVEEESPLSLLKTQPSRPDLLIEPPNIIPPQQQSMSQCLEGEDFRLPLQTEEDLNRFLVYLNDEGNFDKMCKRQANVGGEAKFKMTKHEMITRNILEKLISNELSKQMTLTGKVKSKRNEETLKMAGTNLQRLLQESVRSNEGAERVSNSDINKYTQHWFRGASDRKGGRKARQKLERAPCVEPDESD